VSKIETAVYQPHILKNKLENKYLFKSKRLGFRNWMDNDLTEFAKLNADLDIMEYFPKPLNRKETRELIHQFQEHYEKFGFNYFATEILKTGEWIGFIGLKYQDYKTEFSPAVDIGWRLKKSAWGNGYATEGARKCLEFTFKDLNLKRVISTCTENNSMSENVMKKIGMIKRGTFTHPKLKEYPEYEKCIWYEISKSKWLQDTIVTR
jgi:RimJ/RimL family protein N-acetyltransferase